VAGKEKTTKESRKKESINKEKSSKERKSKEAQGKEQKKKEAEGAKDLKSAAYATGAAFSTHVDGVEEDLRSKTVGLVTLSELKQQQQNVVAERERQIALKLQEDKKKSEEDMVDISCLNINEKAEIHLRSVGLLKPSYVVFSGLDAEINALKSSLAQVNNTIYDLKEKSREMSSEKKKN